MPAHAHFEIDIRAALADQLLTAFSNLQPAPLATPIISVLPDGQGIYQLLHQGTLVYIGKADSLKRRLAEHRRKIEGRRNIDVSQMTFECLYVHENWTALAPERALIDHYRAEAAGVCEWNGTGFGPHDPGRERETTNRPPEGFDALYPIHQDWPCGWIEAEPHNGSLLLRSLKERLPFLLRYQTVGSLAKGHPDYNAVTIHVPRAGMGADELLAFITTHLAGWQSTQFSSHLILYHENRDYTHGKVLARG